MLSFSKDPLLCRFYHPDLVLMGISILPFETCKRCKISLFSFCTKIQRVKPQLGTWAVWLAQCVCSWSRCTGCLFPPQSQLARPWSTSCAANNMQCRKIWYIKQLLYTNCIYRTCFCRRVNYSVWQYRLYKWKNVTFKISNIHLSVLLGNQSPR